MSIVKKIKDAVIASSNQATWEEVRDTYSDELIIGLLEGDFTLFTTAIAEGQAEGDFTALTAGEIAIITAEAGEQPTSQASEHFQATKSTSFTVGTAFTNVTAWNAPTHTAPPYTWNATNGELTLEEGTYKFSAWGMIDSIGNNRVELNIQLTVNGTLMDNTAYDAQYSARNNVNDQGSAQLHNYIHDISNGDIVRVQIRRIGANADLLRARLNVEKIG